MLSSVSSIWAWPPPSPSAATRPRGSVNLGWFKEVHWPQKGRLLFWTSFFLPSNLDEFRWPIVYWWPFPRSLLTGGRVPYGAAFRRNHRRPSCATPPFPVAGFPCAAATPRHCPPSPKGLKLLFVSGGGMPPNGLTFGEKFFFSLHVCDVHVGRP